MVFNLQKYIENEQRYLYFKRNLEYITDSKLIISANISLMKENELILTIVIDKNKVN